MFSYLNSSRCGGCKASNLAGSRCILCEPDCSLGIDRDAVRIASRRGNRIFYHCLSEWVEKTDVIRAKLGEPEVAICIEDQAKGCTPVLQVPLVPARVRWIIFAQRITGRLRKPDTPFLIYNHKERACVSSWLIDIRNEGAI